MGKQRDIGSFFAKAPKPGAAGDAGAPKDTAKQTKRAAAAPGTAAKDAPEARARRGARAAAAMWRSAAPACSGAGPP
jgi:hypothetical protein